MESAVASPERDASHEPRRKALLVCGIVSSLLYGAMIGAIRFEGYSLVSQVPSELTAIGAPTRTLWMWLGSAYTVLVAALDEASAISRPEPCRADRGRLMLAYGSLAPLAVCRDAPARGAGSRRRHWSDTMQWRSAA
jgi:hypothetical protein